MQKMITNNGIIRLKGMILWLILVLMLFGGCNKQEETAIEPTETVLIEKKADKILEDGFTKNIDGYIEYVKKKYNGNERKVATTSKIDKLVFAGDIILSERIQKAYDSDGIKRIISDEYREIIDSGDLFVANLECVLTDSKEDASDKQYTFQVPSKYSRLFKDANIGLLTLANNHILDFGERGLKDTMDALDKENINYIGAGTEKEANNGFIKFVGDRAYAIFATSAVIPKDSWKASGSHIGVSNGVNIAIVCEEIKKIKPYVDKVIVYIHWGKELATVSDERQKQLAYTLVRAGADLIVGTHSHTVQELEFFHEVPIVYSLGNFIYGRTMRDTSVLTIQYDYSKNPKGELTLQMNPGISAYERTSKYWKNEDIENKAHELQEKSDYAYIDIEGYGFALEFVERVEEEKNLQILDERLRNNLSKRKGKKR